MPRSPQSNLDAVQKASAEQFNKQSDRYGRSHILAHTADIEETLSGIKVPAGGHALDVATGGGHTALFLARAGWSVTAGDISPRMLDNASRLLKLSGFTLSTALFPAEEIPFGSGTFDLVTVRVAPHHFSSPPDFIAEAARVLKSGGHLMVIDGTVPDNDPESEDWLHRVEKWRDPSHVRFLSRASWEKLVRASGLTLLLSELSTRKQPDLSWYFETAATPPENRRLVLQAVKTAPKSVRTALRLSEQEGKIVWWWPILRLLAAKP